MSTSSQLHKAVTKRQVEGMPYDSTNPYYMSAETNNGGAVECSVNLVGNIEDGAVFAIAINSELVAGGESNASKTFTMPVNSNGLGFWNPTEAATYMAANDVVPTIGTASSSASKLSWDVSEIAGVTISACYPRGSTYTAP
jgi:hypothetical protein